MSSNTGELAGKVALVTGAAAGMGRAIAVRLAEAGASVSVNDLSHPQLEETVAVLEAASFPVLPAPGDVTDRGDVDSMIATTEESLGPVDILVNNAGVLAPTPFLEITEEEWDWVLDVNLKGTFNCTQAIVAGMVDRGWGRIVNMSSTAGKNVSTMGGAHYTTAKTAIIGLTRAVANEVANRGVTVNAVCPGLFDTDMMRRTISQEQAGSYARSFPIPRLGRPEEVADLVAYIASDRAEYITGAAFDINGGDLMV